MKTYITIYLTNGSYTFRCKNDIDPTIWIEPGSPNIFMRIESHNPTKCKSMLGDAWKFTLDPFRDTLEIYCGISEETHPERIIIEKSEDNVSEVILDYIIPRERYLSGERIIINEGDILIQDVYLMKPRKLSKF